MKRYKSVLVFFLSFLVYVFTLGDGMFRQSQVPHYVYLAHTFLHGQVNLLELPPSTYDLIFFQDKWYVPGAIAPALIMMPFVLVAGLKTSDIFISVLLGAFNITLLYTLLGILLSGKKERNKVWLTVLFAVGTVHWWVSSIGDASFLAHTLSVTFSLLFVKETISNKRPWLAGIWIGLASLSRPTMIFGSVFFIVYTFLQEESWKRKNKVVLSFLFPLSISIGIMLTYNAVRFGNFTDFGYNYVQGHPVLTSVYSQHGGFNALYMPCNIYTSLLGLPIFNSKILAVNTVLCGHIVPSLSSFSALQMRFFNPLGMSVFFTTPAFFLLFRKKNKSTPLAIAAFSGIVAIAIPVWMYHNTGFLQFGYRYILDLIVFIFILLANNDKEFRFAEKALISLSVLINFVGMNIMYAFFFNASWFQMWKTLLQKVIF